MSPKTRQILYSLGTVASAGLTLLVALSVIDSGTAANLTSLIGVLSGLLGTAATGTAAVVTKNQIRDGILSPASDAVDRAVNGLKDVAATYESLIESVTQGLARVQSGAESLSSVSMPSIDVTLPEGSLAEAARQAAQND